MKDMQNIIMSALTNEILMIFFSLVDLYHKNYTKSIFKIHKFFFSFLLHKFLSNTLDFAFCLANSKTVINIYRKIFLIPILGDYCYFLN